MDWNNISVAAVAVLSLYFSEAGKSVAKNIGEDFYKWIKEHLEKTKNKNATTALSLVKEKPKLKSRRSQLSKEITKAAQQDPNGFGFNLKKRVESISKTNTDTGKVIGQIIADKVVMVDVVIGDINIT